jgi:hypothetical protein
MRQAQNKSKNMEPLCYGQEREREREIPDQSVPLNEETKTREKRREGGGGARRAALAEPAEFPHRLPLSF